MSGKLCLQIRNKFPLLSNNGIRFTRKYLHRNLSLSHSFLDKDKDDLQLPAKEELPKTQDSQVVLKPYERGELISESYHVTEDTCVLQEYKDYQDQIPKYEPEERVYRVLKHDVERTTQKVKEFVGLSQKFERPEYDWHFRDHADYLIIGGGAIGSSIAYWLKTKAPHGFRLMVLEKDLTYSYASTTLSVGGLRQQFSLPESIQMSLFGAEFLRTMKRTLKVEGQPPPDANFQPYGYLLLASDKGAETLRQNSHLQISLGAKNVLLDPKQLKLKFPWINTDGVALGCLGIEHEGWFDPWSLLNGLKQKAINLHTEYVQGEAVGFEFDHIYPGDFGKEQCPRKVIVKLPNGKIGLIEFAVCIIAAGPFSGHVARLARIGLGNGVLSCPLPVEPRKRYVYCFHSPNGPGLNTPLTIDPNGTYFRREGVVGNYICGVSPSEEEEPSTENLDVDYEFFDNRIWPTLAHRVPTFENLKLKTGWAGYYEYNPLDMNGIVGWHPCYQNFFFATGFSGHGIQHAPAVGRAVAEYVLDGRYETIDLTRFNFHRLAYNDKLIQENNVW